MFLCFLFDSKFQVIFNPLTISYYWMEVDPDNKETCRELRNNSSVGNVDVLILLPSNGFKKSILLFQP